MTNKLAELFKKFKSSESEGGSEITDDEQEELQAEAEKSLFKRLSPARLTKTDLEIDKDRIEEIRKAYLDNPDEYRLIKTQLQPSKNFWTNTAFGRTLSGRNKAGRVVRRIGGVAGAVGGSLLGIDLGIFGDILGGASDASQGLAILDQIETILLIVAGIVGMIAGGADYAEIRGERNDDREVMEGKTPTIRKLMSKLKGDKK